MASMPMMSTMLIMPMMGRRDKHTSDTRVVRSLQRYDFEDPYEVTKQDPPPGVPCGYNSRRHEAG